MSNFIATWNAIALDWGLWLANAAVQSAWVLALVTGLWLLIRKRGSAHFGYALFLLPLVPLAIPSFWSLQLDSPAPSVLTSLLPTQWLGSASAPSADASPFDLIEKPSPTTDLGSASDTQTQPSPFPLSRNHAGSTLSALPSGNAQTTSTPTWIAWTFLAWVLITLSMLVLFVKTQICTAKQVGTTSALSTRNAKRVCVVLNQLNAPQHIQVLECSGVAGPAAWGIRKPRILFPPNMMEELDDSQLAWVIGHELAHHKRFDLLVGAAQRVVQIAWFFHPLVWWQCRKLNHLRECACDETSQVRTQTCGKQCAQALLQVAAQSSLPQNPRFALQTLHNDKQTMKHRIHRLMNTKRTARAGMTPLAIPLLLLAAGISSTTLRFQTADAAPISTVGKAQSWLIDQQMPDGHWPAGPSYDHAAGEFSAVGITGLVLLSLEHPDESVDPERRNKAVALGLAYLKPALENAVELNQQNQQFQDFASHAIATHAWLNAHKNSSKSGWRSTAENAIKAIVEARNPYGAWGYEFTPTGEANTFNSTLAMLTLATAKEMGFEFSTEAYISGNLFLDQRTDKESGRVGYSQGRDGDVRMVSKKESHPIKFTELATAMSILAQANCGIDVTKSQSIQLGFRLLSSKAPGWNTSTSNVDYYYWYFGMEAMKLAGGDFEQKWKDRLNAALLNKQLDEEGLDGSFPAIDAWSEPKATVHATVMATLALQAAE